MGRIEREVEKLWRSGKLTIDEIAQQVGILTRDVLAILKELQLQRCGHCGRILDGSIQRCSNDGLCTPEGQPESKG